jgi:23S rRNA (guanosine2251-2'-O)-methyltransferase
VIRQERHAAPLDGVVAKTSAGAVSHVRIATVVNIARAVEELKREGVWTMGLDERGEQSYDTLDFTMPMAVVLGAEGSGLRRLVRDRCDFTASIPMSGQVSSLNVSVAAGIVLFEAARQRRAAQGRTAQGRAAAGPRGGPRQAGAEQSGPDQADSDQADPDPTNAAQADADQDD